MSCNWQIMSEIPVGRDRYGRKCVGSQRETVLLHSAEVYLPDTWPVFSCLFFNALLHVFPPNDQSFSLLFKNCFVHLFFHPGLTSLQVCGFSLLNFQQGVALSRLSYTKHHSAESDLKDSAFFLIDIDFIPWAELTEGKPAECSYLMKAY